MKKLLAIAMISMFAITHTAHAQEKCLSEIMFQKDAISNPQLIQNRENLDNWIKNFAASKRGKAHTNRTPGPATYIIPTVVHVIHYGGGENISKAQIDDQIRILNLDYRRLNPDTTNTPAAFQILGADAGIEFRLAQIDPNGNCTDGVTRHYSNLTFNARNNVKAFDYWPNDKYFNVWVVESIANTNGSPGDVIGFAQFPGGGSDTTDGVVVKSTYFGSIGTAASSNENGRTLTHEAGHWLSLRHIWGDDAGACSGSDNIPDTPNQADWNLSTCPTWPELDACTTTSPGILFSDYMDYTNGNCMNIFTTGQALAMEGTLLSSVSHRDNLWSAANLIATGTDGTPPVLCSPKADFNPRPKFVCAGGNLNFNDASWNGKSTSRLWTFQGGIPATDTSANPIITYPTGGVYDVTLAVTNSAGTDTKTLTGLVNVSNLSAPLLVPFSEGFETGIFPYNDWYAINPNGGAGWAVTSNAAKTGTKSIYLNNYNNNDKGLDEFILPAMDFTNVTGATMTFDMAFAFKTTTGSNADKLVIYSSTDCGKTWNFRKGFNAAFLQSTTGAVGFNFNPVSSQWKQQTVSLSAVTALPNVRLRFEFTHDNGNNLYLDNININGTVVIGVDEINAQNASVNIYPNPSSTKTYVDFNTIATGHVKIELMDTRGRIINTYENNMPSGDHQYQLEDGLEKGVYLVRLTFGEYTVTKKVVIE